MSIIHLIIFICLFAYYEFVSEIIFENFEADFKFIKIEFYTGILRKKVSFTPSPKNGFGYRIDRGI
jgi:hypothetical protein